MKNVLDSAPFLSVDNFLPNYGELRRHADAAVFEDVVSDADGVTYPEISSDIPPDAVLHIGMRLEELFQKPPQIDYMFMRRSSLGVPVPHQAHSDESMGDYSLMLYLSEGEGGTAFLEHKEQAFSSGPLENEEHKLWERDTNKPEAWETLDLCRMAENRACIFRSNRMHRAEPVGGFGTTPQDSRLVLTAFFRV